MCSFHFLIHILQTYIYFGLLVSKTGLKINWKQKKTNKQKIFLEKLCWLLFSFLWQNMQQKQPKEEMVYFGSQLKKYSPWWCRRHGRRNTRWMYYACHQERSSQKMGLPMNPEGWLQWPPPLLPGRLYLLKQDHNIQKQHHPLGTRFLNTSAYWGHYKVV